MSWNYRIFKGKDNRFTIREAYYNKENQIYLFREDSMEPWGTSANELIADLERMLRDAKRFKDEVLDENVVLAEIQGN